MFHPRLAGPVVRAGCIAAVCAFLVPGGATADCKIYQTAEFAIRTDRNRPIIAGAINGQPVNILMDTGSALSLVWRPAAKRLGLPLLDASHVRLYGVGGESAVQSTTIKELTIGSTTVRNLQLAVAGDVNSDFEMVLGEDFFGRVTVEIDLPHRAVRLFQPKGCKPEQLAYWSKTYSLADLAFSPSDRPAIETTVVLNGHSIRAVLDSGAMVSVVSATAAERAGGRADAGGPDPKSFSGIGQRSLPSWIGVFDSFTLGDETIQNARLRIAEMNANNRETRLGSRIATQVDILPKMQIGADFLLSHRVMVDGPDRKLIFTYAGGPVFQAVRDDGPAEVSPQAAATEPPVRPVPAASGAADPPK